MEDISNGLESIPVPCKPRLTSSESSYPTRFRVYLQTLSQPKPLCGQYVRRNIPGPGSEREAFEDQLCGCDCLQGCHQTSCPCVKRFGQNYMPTTGRLIASVASHSTQKPIVECNSQCACKASCSNRKVQHGPGVKLSVAPSGMKGFGLFASEDIKQLAFVCEYAGEVIGKAEAHRRLERKDNDMNYMIVLREHCETGVVLTCVDPQCIGNMGRFANHSCDPNLVMVPVRVDSFIPRLALFARRDISAGEELSFDYSGEASFHCHSSLDNSSTEDVAGHKMTHIPRQSGGKQDTQLKEQAKIVPEYTETDIYSVNTKDQQAGTRCSRNHVEGDKKSCVDINYASNSSHTTSSNKNISSRKRGLSSRTDKCDDTNERLEEPQRKHLVLSDNGPLSVSYKQCLCGSRQCKGYLPFDGSIFNT